MACLVEMVPVRIRLTAARPSRDMAQAALAFDTALANQDLGFDDVARELGRGGGASQIYQHVFALQNNPLPAPDIPGSH